MNQRLGRRAIRRGRIGATTRQDIQHLLDNLRLQCRKVGMKRLGNGVGDDLLDLTGLRFVLFVVPIRHAGKPFA